MRINSEPVDRTVVHTSVLRRPLFLVSWTDDGAGGAERIAEWKRGLDLDTALNTLLVSFGTQTRRPSAMPPVMEAELQDGGAHPVQYPNLKPNDAICSTSCRQVSSIWILQCPTPSTSPKPWFNLPTEYEVAQGGHYRKAKEIATCNFSKV